MNTNEMAEAVLDELLDDLFTYHKATPEQIDAAINDAAKAFAKVVLKNCPSSPDCSDAIRSIRNARMTANASIATKSGGKLPYLP